MGCEASELLNPEVREQLEASGLVLGFSEDTSLVVDVRGPSAKAWQSTLPRPDRPTQQEQRMCEAKAARVTILRDRTTAALAAETDNKLTVWWCIFGVTFGHLSDRDEPLQRSGLNKVRICVYHVNNFAARRRPEIVRGHLAAMALDVCQLQADIVAGDANGAAYSFYKRQRNSSLR